MRELLRILLLTSIVLLIMQQLFAWHYLKTFPKEEIDALFEPIFSKYGIKIVYEIGDDFFSPLENPPIPDGPHQNSKVKPMRHRVLVRYPDILQKAFDKYPVEVIERYLNRIHFAGEIDQAGFKFGGSYDDRCSFRTHNIQVRNQESLLVHEKKFPKSVVPLRTRT
jgi:hypothetical protein